MNSSMDLTGDCCPLWGEYDRFGREVGDLDLRLMEISHGWQPRRTWAWESRKNSVTKVRKAVQVLSEEHQRNCWGYEGFK